MGRVYRCCSRDTIFASGSQIFFGAQTVKNDFQLSKFLSRVVIEVLGNVNCNHNPKHISTNVKSSLSETTGYIIRLDLVVHWQLVALSFDTRIE